MTESNSGDLFKFYVPSAFILIHVLNYCLRQDLKTSSGKVLTSFCLQRLFAHGSFVVADLSSGNNIDHWTRPVCYYSMISVLCGSSVISYEVRRTLKKPIDVIRDARFSHREQPYRWYVLYSTLLPVIALPLILNECPHNDGGGGGDHQFNTTSSLGNNSTCRNLLDDWIVIAIPSVLLTIVALFWYLNCVFVIYWRNRQRQQLSYVYRKRFLIQHAILTVLSNCNTIFGLTLIFRDNTYTSVFIVSNWLLGFYVLILFTYHKFLSPLWMRIGRPFCSLPLFPDNTELAEEEDTVASRGTFTEHPEEN